MYICTCVCVCVLFIYIYMYKRDRETGIDIYILDILHILDMLDRVDVRFRVIVIARATAQGGPAQEKNALNPLGHNL